MDLTADIQEEIIVFTQELVRLDSPSGGEEVVAKLVKAKMKTMDFDEIFTDVYGNVVGIRAGKAPGTRVLFDAHMDVVPVKDPERWTYIPFGGELREGKIWGRGATDIKGGLAGMLIALGRLPRNAFNGTLILTATVGEELIEGIALQKVIESTHPEGVVIVEPTECHLGTAQKGRAGFWINVKGRPAHTSHPENGENAIYKAMEIVKHLRISPLPEDPSLGKGVMELIEINSAPFPGECTVPYGCNLRYDRRLVSGETQASIRDNIERTLSPFKDWQFGFNQSGFTTYTGQSIRCPDFHPGWVMEETSLWVRKAAQGLKLSGISPEFFVAPYCTNGSYSAGLLKLPTVIFGPSTVGLAHIIDEHIEVNELLHGAKGLVGLATSLTEGTED